MQEHAKQRTKRGGHGNAQGTRAEPLPAPEDTEKIIQPIQPKPRPP